VRVGGNYTLRAACRSLDSAEDEHDFYDAEILEFALGMRW